VLRHAGGALCKLVFAFSALRAVDLSSHILGGKGLPRTLLPLLSSLETLGLTIPRGRATAGAVAEEESRHLHTHPPKPRSELGGV